MGPPKREAAAGGAPTEPSGQHPVAYEHMQHQVAAPDQPPPPLPLPAYNTADQGNYNYQQQQQAPPPHNNMVDQVNYNNYQQAPPPPHNMAGQVNYNYQQQASQPPAVVQFPPPSPNNINNMPHQHQQQAPAAFPPANNNNVNNNNAAHAFPPQNGYAQQQQYGNGYMNNGMPPASPQKAVYHHAPSPVNGVPMAAAGTPVSAWKSGLFDCMDDPMNAIITAFFPCLTFGQVAEIVDGGHTSCGTSGMLYGLVGFFLGVPFIMSCTYRTKLRNMFGLPESPAPDWVLTSSASGAPSAKSTVSSSSEDTTLPSGGSETRPYVSTSSSNKS